MKKSALDFLVTIDQGSGEVFGSLAEDVVNVAGLTSEHQTIGLVEMESNDFQGYPNSGILGLAFSTISATGRPTLFENLMKQDKLMAPFFSVHLARGTEDGSEVPYLALDPTYKHSPVTVVPWLFRRRENDRCCQMGSCVIEDVLGCERDGTKVGRRANKCPGRSGSCKCRWTKPNSFVLNRYFEKAIDTGTTLIYVPDPIAQTVYSSVMRFRTLTLGST